MDYNYKDLKKEISEGKTLEELMKDFQVQVEKATKEVNQEKVRKVDYNTARKKVVDAIEEFVTVVDPEILQDAKYEQHFRKEAKTALDEMAKEIVASKKREELLDDEDFPKHLVDFLNFFF